MENNIFKVKNLCFAYDENTPVLRHLDFSIKKGIVTTIIGANGCGKSTLFQVLVKNFKASIGNVKFNNINIDDFTIKEYSKLVAIVNQYNVAPDDLTVKEVVQYGRTPHRKIIKNQKEIDYDDKKVEKAMKITGVYKYKNKYINNLSGGQKQRVWIAMAIAQDTKVLFLDEPTTYLDIKYQIQILKLIRNLNKKLGMTIIMILHDINQVLEYSDEVIALSPNGEILGKGLSKEIITEENIKKMYDINLKIINLDDRKFVLTI